MYRCIAFCVIFVALSGCAQKRMSADDTAKEKKMIESAINTFLTAYQSKDFASMKKVLSSSDDLMWFGTDSAEIIRGIAGWEAQTTADWQVFSSIKIGDPMHLAILVDNDAQLASAIYEVPADVVIAGQPSHFLFRFADTLRKENGEWRFVQGTVAVATNGQSSAEMAAKMKASPAMKN